MFKLERQYCRTVLQGVTDVEKYIPQLVPCNSILSYAYPDETDRVYLGWLTRVFGKTKHSALHETIHVLTEHFPLTRGIMRPFGAKADWDAKQDLWAWATRGSYFVSRYAATHPEEDFVETAIAVLKGENLPNHYSVRKRAVQRWLKKISQ